MNKRCGGSRQISERRDDSRGPAFNDSPDSTAGGSIMPCPGCRDCKPDSPLVTESEERADVSGEEDASLDSVVSGDGGLLHDLAADVSPPVKNIVVAWQACPVCRGRGIVPHGFFQHPEGQPFSSTATGPDPCSTCKGSGILAAPDDLLTRATSAESLLTQSRTELESVIGELEKRAKKAAAAADTAIRADRMQECREYTAHAAEAEYALSLLRSLSTNPPDSE